MTGSRGADLFQQLGIAADTRNWCMTYPCTTCATQDARSEIVRWVIIDEDSLLGQLEKRSFEDHSGHPPLGVLQAIARAQILSIQEGLLDDFTLFFLTHIPPGGSVVLQTFGVVPFEDAEAALKDYRRRRSRPYDRLVEAWVAQIGTDDSDIRYADDMLFYELRHAPRSSRARAIWIEKCIELALMSGDVSLHESLIYSLGTQVAHRPALLASCRQLSRHRRVRRALTFVGLPLDVD